MIDTIPDEDKALYAEQLQAALKIQSNFIKQQMKHDTEVAEALAEAYIRHCGLITGQLFRFAQRHGDNRLIRKSCAVIFDNLFHTDIREEHTHEYMKTEFRIFKGHTNLRIDEGEVLTSNTRMDGSCIFCDHTHKY